MTLHYLVASTRRKMNAPGGSRYLVARHFTTPDEGAMRNQSTPSSAICPDCGGPKYRYAKFCKPCSAKGDRNPRFGKTATPETREKIRAAALARPKKPRKKRSSTDAAGRDFALRWFPLPAVCDRCGKKPPVDRHHQDANPQNNAPENVRPLCRRCHQETDGRLDLLRAMGAARREQTHCKRGHPLDAKRQCPVCRREAVRRYKARKAVAAEMSKRILRDDAPLFSAFE
jgi:hypothetical protein